MKVLIAGGAGFAGSNLALYLSGDHEVMCADNLSRRGSEKNLLHLKDGDIDFVHADVRCREDWVSLKKFCPDVIINAAAQPSAIDGYENPRLDFSANTFAVVNMLEVCRDVGAGIIFFSTNKVYPVSAVHDQQIDEYEDRYVSRFPVNEDYPLDGGDRSLYGCSKIMADLMIQEWSSSFGIKAIVNRFSCLAGPRQWGKVEQGWVAWWLIAHHFQLPLSYIGFKGKQVRDVLFASDMCRLIDAQLRGMEEGIRSYPEVFNVGGGNFNSLSLIEATRFAQDITHKQTIIETLPDERRADFVVYVSDTDKVQKAYNWFPVVDIDEGFREIYDWILDNENDLASMYAPHLIMKLKVEDSPAHWMHDAVKLEKRAHG